MDGNYYFFTRDVDPRTTTPQSQDKFCVTKEDGSSMFFLYQSYKKWGMFERDSNSPTIESIETMKWPWESGVTWEGVGGSINSDAVFEFKEVRWSGVVEYNPVNYPETKYGILYSNSDGTMGNQDELKEGLTYARYTNNNKYYLTIQKDADGYRWYYKGKYSDSTVNRTYHAKVTAEELGWPWDNYDWYPVKRSYWMEDMATFDFRNMDNIEKVNKGPYNWSINVTVNSQTYTLTCNNNDPDGTVMPYCKFVGSGPNGNLFALHLCYGNSDNTFRWAWQSYGPTSAPGSYSNQTFGIDSIVWPWDSSVSWTGDPLTIAKN